MIEVHLRADTLAELADEMRRVLGPLLAAQGVVLPEAPKRGRPRKDASAPEPVEAAEAPPVTSMSRIAEEAPAPEQEPAPEPRAETPPSLEEMRKLLSQYQTNHPRGLAAVLDLMREHGGAARLAECPVETWPAIAAAIEQYLARGAAA